MPNAYSQRILVTDDQPEILKEYVRILSPLNYPVTTASGGEEAISLVKNAVAMAEPFVVAFLDMDVQQGLGGVKAVQEITKIDPHISFVLVKEYSGLYRHPIKCEMPPFLCLHKPIDPDELIQIASILTEKWNLHKMIKKQTEELKLAHTITIRALAELAESRDTDTGDHLKRVAGYSKLIAQKLKEKRELKWRGYITNQYIEDIFESSILHDIGKVGIPDTILLKPGKLTAEEFELMKTHTTVGGDTLTKADKEVGVQSFLTLGKEIAYYHHEKFDGTGYPRGLKGEQIPLSARIVALADVYDALTSHRPYRKALSHNSAFQIISEEMGSNHFDPVILEIFYGSESEFKKIREN